MFLIKYCNLSEKYHQCLPLACFLNRNISLYSNWQRFWGLQKFLNQSKCVWVNIQILISITERRGIFNCLSRCVCILEVYVEAHLSPKYSLKTKWSLSFSHILYNLINFFLFPQNVIKFKWFTCIWKKYEVKKKSNPFNNLIFLCCVEL